MLLFCSEQGNAGVVQSVAWSVRVLVSHWWWENRAYVHIKFDHIFRLRIAITLWLNIAYQLNFCYKCTANNGLFITSYRLHIAFIVGKINRIM